MFHLLVMFHLFVMFQLINALKEQEVCNQKLRAYIEGILIRVIERHPEILEIGTPEGL